MATSTSQTHLPPLGGHTREEVGNELQATLVELLDLSLIGKQLHWTIVGPQFLPLHLQLDELIESWREFADTVAERAVAIGFIPDGQTGAIETGSQLTEIERGLIEDQAVVRHLARMLAETSEHCRGRMDRLGELDSASQDILIEIVRELEKQLWMARAQLPQ
jgi:starvation-inducible DNA-binding protein